MKTYPTLIALLFAGFFPKAQCLKDSMYNYYSAASVNSGLPDHKAYLSYDANDNNTLVLNLAKQGSAYVNSFKASYTFNLKKKTTGSLFQNWNNATWQNSGKNTFSYSSATGDTILNSHLIQNWDNTSNSWVNSWQIAYSYTDAAHPSQATESIDQDWNLVTNSWRNNAKVQHIFYASGKEKRYNHFKWDTINSIWVDNQQISWTNHVSADTILYESWQSGTSSWLKTQKTILTYTTNGIVTTNTSLNWNAITSSWDNAFYYTYTYDNNGYQTEQDAKLWDFQTSAWIPFYKNVYTRNANGDILSHINQLFTNNNWQNSTYSIYTYNAFNQNITYRQQSWNTATSSWDNNSGTDNFVKCAIGTGLEENGSGSFQVYPNPSGDLIRIRSEKAETLSVFKISGELMGIYPDAETIDIQQWPSGIYFIKTPGGRHIKFIKP